MLSVEIEGYDQKKCQLTNGNVVTRNLQAPKRIYVPCTSYILCHNLRDPRWVLFWGKCAKHNMNAIIKQWCKKGKKEVQLNFQVPNYPCAGVVVRWIKILI